MREGGGRLEGRSVPGVQGNTCQDREAWITHSRDRMLVCFLLLLLAPALPLHSPLPSLAHNVLEQFIHITCPSSSSFLICIDIASPWLNTALGPDHRCLFASPNAVLGRVPILYPVLRHSPASRLSPLYGTMWSTDRLDDRDITCHADSVAR
jgi:hypothetical protein